LNLYAGPGIRETQDLRFRVVVDFSVLDQVGHVLNDGISSPPDRPRQVLIGDDHLIHKVWILIFHIRTFAVHHPFPALFRLQAESLNHFLESIIHLGAVPQHSLEKEDNG
jgi:hypothetical protein